MNFLHSIETADFSWSIKLLANAPKLRWKYFIVSRKRIWLPMFAKLISVGFLPPILRSLVLQTPALKCFRKGKKSNLKRLCNNSYFAFVFSNFCLAEPMCVSYYFTTNMQMMCVSLIVYYPFSGS